MQSVTKKGLFIEKAIPNKKRERKREREEEEEERRKKRKKLSYHSIRRNIPLCV